MCLFDRRFRLHRYAERDILPEDLENYLCSNQLQHRLATTMMGLDLVCKYEIEENEGGHHGLNAEILEGFQLGEGPSRFVVLHEE